MTNFTTNKYIPALRFPGFEGEWIEKCLGEIAKIERGRFSPRPRNNPIYYGGNFPFVQTSDVVNSGGRIARYSQTLNEKGLKVSRLFPKGTILITIAANIGYAGVLDIPMACPDSLIGISCNKETYNYFLNYLFQIHQKRMDHIAESAAQKNINIEFLKFYPVLLPRIPEQQKIASFLSSVDQRIQLLTKKKEKLEQYKKGVMQRIFNQELRFKDENGQDYPEWEEKRLGGLTFKTGRKNKDGHIYSVYSINNKDGFLPQSEQFEGIDSNARGFDTTMYKIVGKNTFAYNPARINVGSIGYSGDLENIIISSLYVCFKTNSSLNDQYLFQYMNTSDFKVSIYRNLEGGVRDYLFYENFSKIVIPLPSSQEQQKIATFLSSLDDKITQVNTRLELTRKWKQGLLQKMFV